jgi:hypothetical protein
LILDDLLAQELGYRGHLSERESSGRRVLVWHFHKVELHAVALEFSGQPKRVHRFARKPAYVVDVHRVRPAAPYQSLQAIKAGTRRRLARMGIRKDPIFANLLAFAGSLFTQSLELGRKAVAFSLIRR